MWEQFPEKSKKSPEKIANHVEKIVVHAWKNSNYPLPVMSQRPQSSRLFRFANRAAVSQSYTISKNSTFQPLSFLFTIAYRA